MDITGRSLDVVGQSESATWTLLSASPCILSLVLPASREPCETFGHGRLVAELVYACQRGLSGGQDCQHLVCNAAPGQQMVRARSQSQDDHPFFRSLTPSASGHQPFLQPRRACALDPFPDTAWVLCRGSQLRLCGQVCRPDVLSAGSRHD